MPLLHVSDCFTNNNNNDPDFGEFTGTKDLDGLGIPLSNQVRIGMYNANDVVTGGVTLFQICAYEGTDKGRDTRCSSNDAYAIRHPLIAGYGPSELCAQPPSDATLCSGDSGTIYTYTTCIV